MPREGVLCLKSQEIASRQRPHTTPTMRVSGGLRRLTFTLCNAGDTLCIPRLGGECTTGIIQHIMSLAMEKLSVEQTKLETCREVCLPVLQSTFHCLLIL